MALPLLVSAILGLGLADDVTIFAQDVTPLWALNSIMQLEVTATVPTQEFRVFPLTQEQGANQSETTFKTVFLHGTMVHVNEDNYADVYDNDTVAFLSCDTIDANTSHIDANIIVNSLMRQALRAILLYSTQKHCCGLGGSDLAFQALFSMMDKTEASETLHLTSSSASVVYATIRGNTTNGDYSSSDGPGSNPAVAMSILYSITGLITLLFIVIIASGAMRAHRYPERYGPRSGQGGGPRQSRAKGLARAMLETLPIVKFGGPELAKHVANMELEAQSNHSAHDTDTETPLSTVPEGPQQDRSDGPKDSSPHSASGVGASVAEVGGGNDQRDPVSRFSGRAQGHDGNIECSICTEDFSFGEDVRVLPCDHSFHPQCVDPWLVNISGTCPLCRLDLRPQKDQGPAAYTENAPQHMPVALDTNRNDEASMQSQRRTPRILDLHRLRYASVEERIEMLRRQRS